ncbi:MAG: nucleotide exchange factor GrpE [Agarilytica sp.]
MENIVSNEQEPENNTLDGLEDDQVTLDSQSAETNEASSTEALLAEVESLRAELAQAKEQSLRAAAEAQNIRRRAEQDVEKAHKFGVEKIINDMLPVVDNLERAIDASTAEGVEVSSVVEGVELTLKTLVDGLNRQKVEPIDPEGEPFNPELHQAMTMVPNPDVEPNTVINVFQKGYTLHGRLVRPAMVVVSKAAE